MVLNGFGLSLRGIVSSLLRIIIVYVLDYFLVENWGFVIFVLFVIDGNYMFLIRFLKVGLFFYGFLDFF
jgi:hypothetical protein